MIQQMRALPLSTHTVVAAFALVAAASTLSERTVLKRG